MQPVSAVHEPAGQLFGPPVLVDAVSRWDGWETV